MRQIMLTVFTACIGLAGAANVANAGLFSATGNVIAMLADDLFLGEAEGHLNGAGTLVIQSQKNPDLSCQGQFTSSAKLGGVGELRCTDGTTASFHFKRLNAYRGHGVANFSRGAMSFAYGLTPQEAEPYLKLPTGKKLTHNGTQLALADR